MIDVRHGSAARIEPEQPAVPVGLGLIAIVDLRKLADEVRQAPDRLERIAGRGHVHRPAHHAGGGFRRLPCLAELGEERKHVAFGQRDVDVNLRALVERVHHVRAELVRRLEPA